MKAKTIKLELGPDPFTAVLIAVAGIIKDQPNLVLVLMSPHDLSALTKVTYARISFRTKEAYEEHEALCKQLEGVTLVSSPALHRGFVVVIRNEE